MSMSSKPALAPQPEVFSFAYPDAGSVDSAGPAARNRPLADAETAARDAGRREGEMQARAACDEQLAQVRETIVAAIRDFAVERTAYYRQVEAEVVQLALNIARKVLHREAQVDPLMLAALVRVALEKIEAGTKVVVRVHPEQLSDCRSYFARTLEPAALPEVVEDASIVRDCCLLQTSLGSTELGIEVQLQEIEKGLMDLMASRPGDSQ